MGDVLASMQDGCELGAVVLLGHEGVRPEHGFEPVRQVAIDEDWSALRFRRAEHIKTMTRSFAMTTTGKEKVGQGKKK